MIFGLMILTGGVFTFGVTITGFDWRRDLGTSLIISFVSFLSVDGCITAGGVCEGTVSARAFRSITVLFIRNGLPGADVPAMVSVKPPVNNNTVMNSRKKRVLISFKIK